MTVLLIDDYCKVLTQYIKLHCSSWITDIDHSYLSNNDKIIIVTGNFQCKLKLEWQKIIERALYIGVPIYLAYTKRDKVSNIYKCKPDSILVDRINGISETGIEISQFFKKQLEFIQIDLI